MDLRANGLPGQAKAAGSQTTLPAARHRIAGCGTLRTKMHFRIDITTLLVVLGTVVDPKPSGTGHAPRCPRDHLLLLNAPLRESTSKDAFS